MMTLGELSIDARKRLGGVFRDRHEADTLLNRLQAEILGCPPYLRVTEPATVVPPEKVTAFAAAVGRLCAGEPVQYVLGYETFYGRRFNVSPAVLIPRPETEELCVKAIEFLREAAGSALCGSVGRLVRPLRVLDLCSGSGCIAWTLAAEVPQCEVTAMDISEAALKVAEGQFDSPDCRQDSASPRHLPNSPVFVQADVTAGPEAFAAAHPELCAEGFDLIVSNPPYVRESERALMRRNVLEHEPALALFVPDDDPLVFYRAIASWAKSLLRPGGACILEINEALPAETAAVFSDSGQTEVFSDLFSKPRILGFRCGPAHRHN